MLLYRGAGPLGGALGRWGAKRSYLRKTKESAEHPNIRKKQILGWNEIILKAKPAFWCPT